GVDPYRARPWQPRTGDGTAERGDSLASGGLSPLAHVLPRPAGLTDDGDRAPTGSGADRPPGRDRHRRPAVETVDNRTARPGPDRYASRADRRRRRTSSRHRHAGATGDLTPSAA